MSGTAPVDPTESVVQALVIRKSFESFLGLFFIIVGVLMMMGAVSIASRGQTTEIKESSGQDPFGQNPVQESSGQDFSSQNSSAQSSPRQGSSSSEPLGSPTWPNSQTELPGAAITPGSGTVSNGVYSNSYFNFSYRLPQWQSGNPFSASQNEYRQDTSDTHQDGTKKYLLLDATGATNNSVQLVAIDASEEPRITPGDIVVAEMAALRSLGGKLIGAAAEKEIGGRTFSIGKAQVNGEVRGASETLYAGFAAVKQGSYVLTWTFFADSPGRLEQLLGTLETVNFER